MSDRPAQPPETPTAGRPVASLASISVNRRRRTATATGKSGDLTAQLAVAPPPPAPVPAFAEPAATAVAPAPAPVEVAAPEVATPIEPDFADAPARYAGEIVAYWNRLRGGRPFPNLDEIDRAFVGSGWQDSMILDFAGEPAMPHISRLGRPSGAVEYLPLMTDWILSRGRHAARRGVALDEVQRFDGEGDSLRFRLLLLPLGTPSGASDCVLCHLSRDA